MSARVHRRRSTLGTIVVAAVALTHGLATMAIVVAAMFIYQQVENHTLQPLVYHRTVQLSPLAIAVTVAAGAELGGVIGALLGIPAAGAIKVVTRELVAWRRGQDAPPAGPRPRRRAAANELPAGRRSDSDGSPCTRRTRAWHTARTRGPDGLSR